jgi:hypothetical protein
VLLPRNRGKPFVGEEGIVAVGGQQELPDGSLIRVGLGQPEGSNYPFWSDRERYLEAVDPFGLGDAAKVACPAKRPLREARTLTMAGMRVVSSTW